MNIIKLILKGILLYSTTIICVLSIAIIDSIYNTNYFFYDILLCIVSVYICIKTINKSDLDKLTFSNYLK